METRFLSSQFKLQIKGFVNPLRNPISSPSQWNVLKSKDIGNREDEIGSGCHHVDPLRNPVADIHGWRALIAKDRKPLTEPLLQGYGLDSNPSFKEFEQDVAVDASLSCWLSPSQTAPAK